MTCRAERAWRRSLLPFRAHSVILARGCDQLIARRCHACIVSLSPPGSTCDNRMTDFFNMIQGMPNEVTHCRETLKNPLQYDRTFKIAMWLINNRLPVEGLWNTSTCSAMTTKFDMIRNMSDSSRTCLCWTTKAMSFAAGTHVKIAARSYSNFSMGLFFPYTTSSNEISRLSVVGKVRIKRKASCVALLLLR